MSREENNVAHSLSKFATRNFVDQKWLYELPDFIKDLILMEQVALSS